MIRGVWAFCIFFCISVSLSRLYVGVHSITDVIGGLVVGSFVGLVFVEIADDVDDWLLNTSYGIANATIMMI